MKRVTIGAETKRTKIFYDTEFTGLHKGTTLISIGCVSEFGDQFYFELTDYDKTQIDDWLKSNVIAHLINKPKLMGNTLACQKKIENWLRQFGQVEMWSDCLSYDWVLFNHLWGHAFSIPKFIYYIPMDLSTYLRIKNIDPDISREEFINNSVKGTKHNSLYDAKVIKACYEKLMGM